MKMLLFLTFVLVAMPGCEITASFYVEKAWDVSPGFTAANPDMKTRLEWTVKVPVGEDAKKPVARSK